MAAGCRWSLNLWAIELTRPVVPTGDIRRANSAAAGPEERGARMRPCHTNGLCDGLVSLSTSCPGSSHDCPDKKSLYVTGLWHRLVTGALVLAARSLRRVGSCPEGIGRVAGSRDVLVS